MKKKRVIPAAFLVVVVSSLLTTAAGILFGRTLGIIVGTLGLIGLGLLLAHTESVQRQIPAIGRLPGIPDHGYRGLRSPTEEPKPQEPEGQVPRTPEQESTDRTTLKALTRIKGELEDISELLTERIKAGSWDGDWVGMGWWYRCSDEVAQAGLTEAHEAGRQAYRAVGKLQSPDKPRTGPFVGDDRKRLQYARSLVWNADMYFRQALEARKGDR